MHKHAFDCRSVGLWGAKVRARKRRCEDKVYVPDAWLYRVVSNYTTFAEGVSIDNSSY